MNKKIKNGKKCVYRENEFAYLQASALADSLLCLMP